MAPALLVSEGISIAREGCRDDREVQIFKIQTTGSSIIYIKTLVLVTIRGPPALTVASIAEPVPSTH